jgi:predicted DNA-binding antitoxin AbrB/MazE fold protein
MLRQVVTATYQDGVLRPARGLSLPERQPVLVVVLPLPQVAPVVGPDLERVAAMQAQARQWLSQQQPDAVRPPLRLTPAQDRTLDQRFDATLAEIRARAAQFSSAELVADVEAALAEAASLSVDERARLSGELEALLGEWAADAD